MKQTIFNLEVKAKDISNENHIIEKEIVALKARIATVREHMRNIHEIPMNPCPAQRNESELKFYWDLRARKDLYFYILVNVHLFHEEYENIKVQADASYNYPSAKEVNFELDDLLDQRIDLTTYQPALPYVPEKTQRRNSAMNVEMILGYLD